MFRRRRSDTPVSRGQALVETALVLPLLVLLLVMGIDFGRVFFGWVALQNAARIGADFAAGTAAAWDGMPGDGISQNKRDTYGELVEADIDAINCALTGGTPPDPTFEDGIDTAPEDEGDYDDGDYAIVDLECSFDLITPLAESVFGGPVKMLAHEEFPIHTIITVGVPEPPVLPDCPDPTEVEVPVLEGLTMQAALQAWMNAGFLEDNFDPPDGVISTGPPGGRNNNKIVLLQNPDENSCQPLDAIVDVDHS